MEETTNIISILGDSTRQETILNAPTGNQFTQFDLAVNSIAHLKFD